MKNTLFLSSIVVTVAAALIFCDVSNAHRFHSSLTRIEYDSDKKNIEITIQLIAHDVTEVFEKITKQSLDLENSKVIDELLKKYLAEHFILQNTNGEKLALEWIGKEIETDRIFVYLEIQSDESIENFKLQNSIFFETYPTQTNIIIALFDGEKADLVFTKKDNFKIIEKSKKENK